MKLRYARHTDNLSAIVRFYNRILGLEVRGSFKDHSNYDGVFLGLPGANCHLEFTRSKSKPVHNSDPDDLLVFYPESNEEYERILKAIDHYNVKREIPENPYWKANGIMIKDPDGFRIVISRQLEKDSM
jgi:catechol 2,3-dioxygenase-like lactoylglutathione lyase family enzyme